MKKLNKVGKMKTKKVRMQNAIKCFVLGIGMISILGISGCSSKAPEEYTLKEVNEELPDWYMQPKNAMGPDYIREVGSDRTSTEQAWRTFTEFRSEGILKKATIQIYKFGPDNKLYVLVCVDKNDIAWESW